MAIPEGKRIVEKTKQHFYQLLLPGIDAALKAKDNGEFIIINKLEVDVGNTTLDQLPSVIEQAMLEQLGKLPLKPYHAVDRNADNLAALLFFMEKGFFPSYAINLSPVALFNEMHTVNRQPFFAALQALFKKDSIATRRFVLQFSLSQHKKFIDTNHPYGSTLLHGWYQFLIKNPAINVTSLERLFGFITTKASKPNFTENFIQQLLDGFFILSTAEKVQIKIQLENMLADNKPVEVLTNFFQDVEALHKNTSVDVIVSGPDAEEELYTPCAGLILLSPFLAMFFKELHLLHDGQFVDTTAQVKAVQLLHFIAFDITTTPEHNLLLQKIICDLPISYPVPATVSLSKKEKATSLILLKSVLQHWRPLNQTTPDGLRQSFLQRPGILKRETDAWILHVEKHTIDILLEELPWSYQVLQHSWTKHLIHVQW